jgi:hypothetical protein
MLKLAAPAALALCSVTLLVFHESLPAQQAWPPYGPPPMMAPPATRATQRNALSGVQSQVRWLQNSTRTASNYGQGGGDLIWTNFQRVRAAFNSFKMTLNPMQLAEGGNEIAELDAGLDILQEAFGNYQDDLAAGRSASAALRDLCKVLGQASVVWLQELNRSSARLGVRS